MKGACCMSSLQECNERSSSSQYRPISPPNVINRPLKAVIIEKIVNHFKEENFLRFKPYGFGLHMSTADVLIVIAHRMSEELNKVITRSSVALDISKTF